MSKWHEIFEHSCGETFRAHLSCASHSLPRVCPRCGDRLLNRDGNPIPCNVKLLSVRYVRDPWWAFWRWHREVKEI